ncbi:putative ribonuclease H-like domain-containing protein [Tanacetum coccineum]
MQEECCSLRSKGLDLINLLMGSKAIGRNRHDEVFAPVARLEAIRIFLAFASYKGLIVYQMDVKSAFLYGKIDEEVYVSQPPGFQDPKSPSRMFTKWPDIMFAICACSSLQVTQRPLTYRPCKVSTAKEGVSTDSEKVSTDRPKLSTDDFKVSTDVQIESTDDQVDASEEIFKGAEDQKESTEDQRVSTEEQSKEDIAS